MKRLYSKMKIFHYKEKLDSLPQEIDAVLAPIHIRLKPTNRCNHNCWYCAYRRANIQLGKDMSVQDQIPGDKIREITEDIIGMGVEAVTFSGGGEPLLYPYLLETVRSLSTHGIKFACLTNGSRLSGEIAELFAHRGTWIRLSMDGWDPASYAEYRSVNLYEFGKVMENIENFKMQGGPCHLGVVLVVDEKNACHIYQMIQQLKDVGVDSVKVSPCIISNDGVENTTYHRPLFELVHDQIQRSRGDIAKGSLELFDAYRPQLDTFEKGYTWCPYIQINPVIGADLNVYSCHDKAYNLDEGLLFSIKQRGFKDMWAADKSVFFKINPSVRCNHHCVVNEKNRMILEYLDVDKAHLAFV